MFFRSTLLIQAVLSSLVAPLLAHAGALELSPTEIRITLNAPQSAYRVSLALAMNGEEKGRLCPNGGPPSTSSLNLSNETLQAEKIICRKDQSQLQASFLVPLNTLKKALSQRSEEAIKNNSCNKPGAVFFNQRDEGEIQGRWGPADLPIHLKVIAVCN